MKGNIVIDLRNALDPENFINSNFNLVQIGRARKLTGNIVPLGFRSLHTFDQVTHLNFSYNVAF